MTPRTRWTVVAVALLVPSVAVAFPAEVEQLVRVAATPQTIAAFVGALSGSIAVNRRTMRRAAREAATRAVDRHAETCPARKDAP